MEKNIYTFVCAAELSEHIALTCEFEVEFDNNTTFEEWDKIYEEMVESAAKKFSVDGNHFNVDDIIVYSKEDWEAMFEEE